MGGVGGRTTDVKVQVTIVFFAVVQQFENLQVTFTEENVSSRKRQESDVFVCTARRPLADRPVGSDHAWRT